MLSTNVIYRKSFVDSGKSLMAIPRVVKRAGLGGILAVTIVIPLLPAFYMLNPELSESISSVLLAYLWITIVYFLLGAFAGIISFCIAPLVCLIIRRKSWIPHVELLVTYWLVPLIHWGMQRLLYPPYAKTTLQDTYTAILATMSCLIPLLLTLHQLASKKRFFWKVLLCIVVMEATYLATESTPRYHPVEQQRQETRSEFEEPAHKLWVIGLDGITWSILAPMANSGLIPCIDNLARSGMRGYLRSLQPMQSPAIWTTIATGKLPEKHGIQDFLIRVVGGSGGFVRTFPLQLSLARESGFFPAAPISSKLRRDSAIWNMVSGRGLSSLTIGWWATWPAERVKGALLSDRIDLTRFQPRGSTAIPQNTYPESLYQNVRQYLRYASDMPPGELQRFLDTATAPPSIPSSMDPIYLLQTAWATTIGRVQAASYMIAKYNPQIVCVYLPGIDYVSHFYWKEFEPQWYETKPDHPERTHTIPLFYQFTDSQLATLINMLSEAVNVILLSDHGFGPAIPGVENYFLYKRYPAHSGLHRMNATLIAKGPDLQSGVFEEEPSVSDICPTILALLGMPYAEDMDGEIITSLLAKKTVPASISTYNQLTNEAKPETSSQDEEILNHLKTLGYIK